MHWLFLLQQIQHIISLRRLSSWGDFSHYTVESVRCFCSLSIHPSVFGPEILNLFSALTPSLTQSLKTSDDGIQTIILTRWFNVDDEITVRPTPVMWRSARRRSGRKGRWFAVSLWRWSQAALKTQKKEAVSHDFVSWDSKTWTSNHKRLLQWMQAVLFNLTLDSSVT